MRQIVMLSALLLVSASASADWKRDYDRGRKAYADGDWTEAEARFRDAFREEAEASHRKRFEGMRFDEYMPHFYAGMAAFRQGRCDAALNYWSNASMQKVFASELPELKAQWQSSKKDCDIRLAAASQPTTPTTGSTTPDAPVKPADSGSSTSTTTVASNTSTTKPPPSPVTNTSPPTRPKDPAPAKISAPSVLREAAELYFSGRYSDLLKLQAQSLPDAKARGHALMLRAAAGFTLAEQSGDQAGLEQARRDVRSARTALASLNPDRAAFSPKFIQFWSSTR